MEELKQGQLVERCVGQVGELGSDAVRKDE